MIHRQDGPPFIIIGENIHASRVVKRDGPRIGELPNGRPAIRFPVDGAERLLPIPDALLETNDYRQGRVKHVMAAMLHGLEVTEHADLAAEYLRWMAARQTDRGADYLDINVDEISHEVSPRLTAMVWAVEQIGPAAAVPISLDSSDPGVIAAGLTALDRAWAAGGALLLNSASLERLDVLEMAVEHGLPVVLSASGDVAMPTNAQERIERAHDIIGAAQARGLPLSSMHVDALVVPIGVDPEAGGAFFDAVRQLRAEYGPDIHLTGGLSNSSFGLPARRLLGDVFLDLAALSGLDSGILDPVASDIANALAPDRESGAYRMAADFILGTDMYGMEFIEAFRAGQFG